LGFVKGAASFSGQYQEYGSTTVKDYKFVVAFSPDSESVPQYLFDQPETAEFNSLPAFSLVLRKGAPDLATHEQVISGLPPAMCGTNLWSINPRDSSKYGTLSLVPPARKIDATPSQAPGCAFTVSFVPSAATLAMPPQTSIPITYSFATAIADKVFEIGAARIPFRTSDYPSLAPNVIGRIPVAVNGTDLQWTIEERVVDDPALPQSDPVLTATKTGAANLSNCTAGSGQLDVPAGGLKIDSTGATITITLQQDFSMTGVPDVSKQENLTSCTLAMKLHLVMKSTKTADVDLSVSTVIAYPKLSTPKFQIKVSPQ